jgi:ribulose-phosphate 3-epimerase
VYPKRIIVPAIIAKTQDDLNEQLIKIGENSPLVQLDIMDNKFVPNTSLDFQFVLGPDEIEYEAHLMIDDPATWIERNGECVDTILVHLESCQRPRDIINRARKKGKKIGFAINPETQIDAIKPYLDEIDQLLIMTVNPGFYGSKFLPETVHKITEARMQRSDLDIEVDGGITPDTIRGVQIAGANMFVSGSFILKSTDVKRSIDLLKNQIL